MMVRGLKLTDGGDGHPLCVADPPQKYLHSYLTWGIRSHHNDYT